METLIRVYSFSVVFNYLFMVFSLFSHSAICQLYRLPTNTLGVNQSLKQHLVSSNGLFKLHFAREGDRSYLAIHYDGPEYIPVWVAFPERIFYGGDLRMEYDGHLTMTYWSTPRAIEYESISLNIDQSMMVRNSVATLLDNGNLIVTDGSRILWQSFDYPSNTWLPGMKIGVFGLNNYNNKRRFLTSWIAGNNPSPGVFTLGIVMTNTTEILVMKKGLPYWRSGNYSEQNFSSSETAAFFNILATNTDCFSGKTESYCSSTDNLGIFFRLSDWGTIELLSEFMPFGEVYTCNDSFRGYGSFHSSGYCIAPNQSSSLASTNCTLKLMVPAQARIGTMDGWSFYSESTDIGLIECQDLCKKNCSCLAYTNASSDGTGCKFYTTENFTYSDSGETIHFLREFNRGTGARNHHRDLKIKVAVGAASGAFLLILTIIVLKRIVFNPGARKQDTEEKDDNDRLITFRLMDIKTGTNNFSDANKLGQGGFGSVYKGKLHDGQEIAVKRLSTVSKHGMEQFKNEVLLISKLQHRNLVRLLGYCSEGDEWLLVYEYLPNKSLDSFIFDAAKRACLLNWKMRVNIIQGIAQGLLYLHKYSRLKIIHRDLKTSNILLDNYMNAKIADFGTARIFRDTDSRLNTKRIIGTFGYMSPEYAIDGHFSEKSDVFSFGVMVLEIISGKKNTGFYNSDHLNLLGYVWDLWIDGRIVDMADPTLSETLCMSSCLRYVQVALMCVQENAADRPVMTDVVSMLTNESIALPIPNLPAFCTVVVPTKNGQTFACQQHFSQNKVTISTIEGR